jgi:predicted TIM-barrel fold metal-dependent hydrolase
MSSPGPTPDPAGPAAGPIFDAHFHVIDQRFPLRPNAGFVPEPFPAEAYRAAAEPLGVVGGAAVAGSFQALDREWLLAALAALGPEFVGVAQLPPSVTDGEIAALDAAGVRAVRFNLYRGGSAGEADLDRLAHRVWDAAGWHVELYLDAATVDAGPLAALPKVVVDHLGLTAAGLKPLLRLVEAGASVKATGFGRVELDVAGALTAVASVNPGALLFGTDLPSTRARRPFRPADIDLVVEALGETNARLALHDNAVALYRPRQMR